MPTDSEIPDGLKALFSDEGNYTSVSYNGSLLTLTIVKEVATIKAALKLVFADVKEYPNAKVEIKLSSVSLMETLIFYNEADYLNKYDKYRGSFDDLTIIILSYGGHFVVKEKQETFTSEKALIFNYPVYRELLEYIIHKNEFTPYQDELNHQFVIISKESGAFYIGYDLLEDRLQDVENLRPLFNELKTNFAKKEFIQFFKEVLIAGTHKSDSKDRFFEITKTLKVLLNLTDRDYDNYIMDFAFDKIKTKFKEERNKYFESLEKSIDSVSKQVVSFPLTFAATAFASYQVKDKPVILGLIVLAYLLYTVIAWKILQFVNYNVTCLTEDVNREETEIKNSYNKMYADFQDDFTKIRSKITRLKEILRYLKFILWGLLALFVGYSLFQIVSVSSSSPNEQTVRVQNSNIKMTIEKKVMVKNAPQQLIKPDTIWRNAPDSAKRK